MICIFYTVCSSFVSGHLHLACIHISYIYIHNSCIYIYTYIYIYIYIHIDRQYTLSVFLILIPLWSFNFRRSRLGASQRLGQRIQPEVVSFNHQGTTMRKPGETPWGKPWENCGSHGIEMAWASKVRGEQHQSDRITSLGSESTWSVSNWVPWLVWVNWPRWAKKGLRLWVFKN